jgi:predicted lysophospholipase L1 biosynthesis ABC-type transport system permease subunit
VVYLESSSSTYKLADCNSATAEVRSPLASPLTPPLRASPFAVLTKGPVTIGATLTAGVAYYLSGTAGGIRPVADNTTGDYPAVLGMASSTTVLVVNIQAPGARSLMDAGASTAGLRSSVKGRRRMMVSIPSPAVGLTLLTCGLASFP